MRQSYPRFAPAVALALVMAIAVAGCGRRGAPEAPLSASPADTSEVTDVGKRKPKKPSNEPFLLDFLL